MSDRPKRKDKVGCEFSNRYVITISLEKLTSASQDPRFSNVGFVFQCWSGI